MDRLRWRLALPAVLVIVGVVLAGCAAPPGAAPPAKQSDAKTKVRVTQSTDSLSFIVTYAARYNGFYADEGLDVDLITTGGGGPDIAALVSGEAQFNVGQSGSLMRTAKQGVVGIHDALGNINQVFLINAETAKKLGVDENSPMEKKLAAFKGGTLGATRPGSISYEVLRFYALKAGLTPGKDVEIVGIGDLPAIAAALKENKVQITNLTPPISEQAVLEGYAKVLFDPAEEEDFKPEFLYEATSTRRDFMEQNPDVVRRFVRAMVRANQWVVNTPDEQIAKAMKLYFPQVKDEVLLASVKRIKPKVNPTGAITKAGFEKAMNFEVNLGSIKEPVKYEDAVTSEFIPK